MIISIASGKGGTGKTTVAVNMALSLGAVQLLDCDVEEPNVHLLLNPKIEETKPVYVRVPVIDKGKCDYCGKCAEFCEYNALFVTGGKVMFFPDLCHGCGGCVIVCPRDAIKEKKRKIGTVKKGFANGIELVYGELTVGEPMAVPIIKEVKEQVAKHGDVIVDSPPGTSCPVIEAVYGSDYCILVTEPTPFGLYDLKIAVEVLGKLHIPFGVIVNQAGIGDNKVYTYCKKKTIPILLEIPYERKIAELYSSGTPFVLKMPEWKEKFRQLFDEIKGGRHN
ncbi:ATP-binding protein [Candidatus Bathyarchaeota archaeon]|nr:ATP-binding protein [Candidatus Bathyarchaeota archaeon]